MKPLRSFFAAACILLAASHVRAASADTLRPIAFQNGVNQQALGAETAELARSINALIDELQRNGFPAQSLSGLTELAAQLNTLGGTEMAGIASRLRRLGETSQTDTRATATEAYLAQQAIETRLKTLARQISIQQLRQETARRLEALITRQLAIQGETRAIAAAKPVAERQRLLQSDQSGIGDDLATFFQTGETLLSRLRENDTRAAAAPSTGADPTVQTFAERINGPYLTTLTTEAVDQLKGKHYPEAYGRQTALIAELRKILQGILSSIPKEQRLADALQQVSALRQQEEASQQAKTPASAEANQAAADQAQTLANQVAPLSPAAAAALTQAGQALQAQAATPSSRPTTTPAGARPPTPPNNRNNGQQQASNQQSGHQQNQNGQQQPGQPQSGQPNTPQGNQPSQAQNQSGQPQNQPPSAAQSLATAENALRNALTQAQSQSPNAQNQQSGQPNTPQGNQPSQAQNQSGQPQNQNGQQQANSQQSGQQQNQNGQQQSGQPQSGQNQQTNNQSIGQNGVPPGRQQGNPQTSGNSGTQNQIAGHGDMTGDPAQVVGALRREEREAFNALQNERYPAEYSAWVQQYWRNLAQDK